jgi:hypothetical protein
MDFDKVEAKTDLWPDSFWPGWGGMIGRGSRYWGMTMAEGATSGPGRPSAAKYAIGRSFVSGAAEG